MGSCCLFQKKTNKHFFFLHQKLIFKPRGKSNKNCSKDPAKGNKNKKKRSKEEKAVEDPRIHSDEREDERDITASRGGKTDATVAEQAAADDTKSEEKKEPHRDEAKMDDEGAISRDDAEMRKGGGGAIADKEEENDREEDKQAVPLVENGDTSATVATEETQSKTKEKEGEEQEQGGVANMVVENGIGTDEEDEVETHEVVAMKKQQPDEALE